MLTILTYSVPLRLKCLAVYSLVRSILLIGRGLAKKLVGIPPSVICMCSLDPRALGWLVASVLFYFVIKKHRNRFCEYTRADEIKMKLDLFYVVLLVQC
jgi:hypothetical protein